LLLLGDISQLLKKMKNDDLRM